MSSRFLLSLFVGAMDRSGDELGANNESKYTINDMILGSETLEQESPAAEHSFCTLL